MTRKGTQRNSDEESPGKTGVKIRPNLQFGPWPHELIFLTCSSFDLKFIPAAYPLIVIQA